VAFYTRSENPFVNYYLVLDVGMAWEASQFGELSRDELVSFSVFSVLLNNIIGSAQRMRTYCTSIVNFVLDFPNLRKTFTNYSKIRKSKLYKNRCAFMPVLSFHKCR
jgi:hypothetical protein